MNEGTFYYVVRSTFVRSFVRTFEGSYYIRDQSIKLIEQRGKSYLDFQ